MRETRFEELKRYVRLSAEDGALMRALHPHAAPEFPRIAREFYDRIREHEEAHAVFTGEEQIQRLQSSLVRWMDRVCSGVYDEAYFEDTAKIGRIHVRIGLPQRYMFTAMALIRVALTRIAEATMGDDATKTREALTRLLDIELAIMLETYQDSFVARIQHVERLEKQELGRALARTQRRYVSAIEYARALILGLDASGNVRLFNREAETVTGFARDEVLGRPFAATFFPDGIPDPLRERFEMLLRGDTSAHAFEAGLKTKAGKFREVAWQLSFAPSGEDDDVVVFAMGSDVTEAKAMEERTRQVEKLAAVGTLAAGLAHEIRNPLNGAQLHVAFLERAIRKKGGDPDMLDAAHVVADEIKRLARLVSEFLDFARPKPLELKTISLFRMCDHVRTMVLPLAEEAHVSLVNDLPSTDIEFQADPQKLEQVFLNLLHNAVQALQPSGGGTVVFRGRRQPRHILFEVEDDGPGLPSPDAPIFDAFFSTKENGTGLGLAITHRIVTDHRGTIEVVSRPGKTLFRTTLPLEHTGGLTE
jgi:PAS domain S-box-containing protein